VVTGAVNGDTINYTPATTATQSLMLDYPIAVTLGANPNYSVVSTNGILRNSKSIAVTVIADGKSKVYGDENALTAAGYWCCQWRRYHQLYPSNYCHSISNVRISYCCDFRDNPNYSVVSTNGILSVTPKVLL
jgi:hypothetical protein